MYRQFVESQIINRKTTHGYPTQYHVVLTDSKGNKEFLWMKDVDYIDWIEDPIVVNGESMMFDPETYHAFA